MGKCDDARWSGHTVTCSRHVEPEHRDQNFVWQIVCAYLSANTKFGSKCSGSSCRERVILALVSSLHICEYVVINKFCLLTSVSDTDRGGTTFSTVAPVKEIGKYMCGDQANKRPTPPLKLHVRGQPDGINHTSGETTRKITYSVTHIQMILQDAHPPRSCVSQDRQQNRYGGYLPSCYSTILALSTPVPILGPAPPRLEPERENSPRHRTRVGFCLLVNWVGRKSGGASGGYLCVL